MKNKFQLVCRYGNAMLATNELDGFTAEDFSMCKIHSFNVFDELVNVFHPITGKVHSVNINNGQGFLVLKRFDEMTEDDAIDLAVEFTGWNKDYTYLAARTKSRILVQNTIHSSKEFNIGLDSQNGQIWIIDIESAELKMIPNLMNSINLLHKMNYAEDYLFDSLDNIAIEKSMVKDKCSDAI